METKKKHTCTFKKQIANYKLIIKKKKMCRASVQIATQPVIFI